MDDYELYGVARDQFIIMRTAWVKALRADGQREEASRVAALRKPSVVAAIVNQLVRTQPERFAVLADAGDALRAAQDRMLSGDGTANEMRDAVERERAAVDALVSAAAGPSMSGAVSDRVADTLHAAGLDTDARAQVRGCRLIEELQHVGFGGASLAAGPAPSSPGRKRSNMHARREPREGQRHDPPGRSRVEAKRAGERERAEQRRLSEESKHARRSEREARVRLEAAERALAKAKQRHEKTRTAFQAAENTLAAAQAEAEAASAAHDTARRGLRAASSTTA